MDVAAVQRFSRQIALPDVGGDGQERLLAARVLLVGADLVIETALRYLVAAGVTRVSVVASSSDARALAERARLAFDVVPPPRDAAGWKEAMRLVNVALRSDFADDALLGAARALGVPVVAVRTQHEVVDLLSFRHERTEGDVPDVVPSPAAPAPDGAAAVLAGTLAATEVLFRLLGRDEPSGARHVKLSLDGGDVRVQEIPWPPPASNDTNRGSR